ncbi:hypothetical protein D9M73_51730 [compost metagenome]
MKIPVDQYLRQQYAADNGTGDSCSSDAKQPNAERKQYAGEGLDHGVTPADVGFA